ncbi:MAG TPA: rhodanese-like domain-containing protein [Steroidobacteraceae bacterium]|nr:rhodanese-like domain-containing protein [Steroidobacteraceae bacterium]
MAPFGLGLVFFNVLLDQLGVPVPAIPTLVVAGALAAGGRLPLLTLIGVAVLASFIADCSWYFAGRRYGGGVMKLVCRISLTPDICVGQAQASFERHGAKLILVAKFIPGVSMITPPLAGAMHMPMGRFAALSVASALLWVGAALLGGVLLREEVEWVLPHLGEVGKAALVVLSFGFAAYIAYKWWQRRRYYSALDMARITVAELYELMQCDPPPVIVDVRSSTAESLERKRIPGSLHFPLQEFPRHIGKLPREREIVLYCSCPHEASAAQAALLLMSSGFRRVRPLGGGLDAWIAAGYAIEEIPASEFRANTPALAA